MFFFFEKKIGCVILIVGEIMAMKKKHIFFYSFVLFMCFMMIPFTTFAATEQQQEACRRANCERDAEGKVLTDSCNDKGYDQCIAQLEAEETINNDITMCGTDIKIDSRIPTFVSNIYNLLKIITPIALVLFGMLDFAKATVAHDDSAISKAGKKFIQRLIAGIAVFLVFTIVQFTADLLDEAGAGSVMGCANCLLNGQCE